MFLLPTIQGLTAELDRADPQADLHTRPAAGYLLNHSQSASSLQARALEHTILSVFVKRAMRLLVFHNLHSLLIIPHPFSLL